MPQLSSTQILYWSISFVQTKNSTQLSTQIHYRNFFCPDTNFYTTFYTYSLPEIFSCPDTNFYTTFYTYSLLEFFFVHTNFYTNFTTMIFFFVHTTFYTNDFFFLVNHFNLCVDVVAESPPFSFSFALDWCTWHIFKKPQEH